MNRQPYSSTKILLPALFITAVSGFVFPGYVSAEESTETQALKMEIEILKIQNAELKEKVKQLEVIVSDRKSRTRGKDKNPWHALVVGMTKEDVKALLGKPGRVDKWKTGEAWYYPDTRGGEVDFDTEGKATGWLEP